MRHGEFSSDPKAVWLTEEGTDDRRMAGLKVRSPAEAVELAEDGSNAEPARHAEQIISLCGLCDLCVETACTTAISPIFSTTAFPTSSD
jgi:hypothetical protein